MQDWFDHERLEVYRYALEFAELAQDALSRERSRALHDQLARASMGIVLCIAEGAGRRSKADKSRFYAMARGSATECAAIFDLLKMRHLLIPDTYLRGRSLLLRLVRMLTPLAGFDSVPAPKPTPEPGSSEELSGGRSRDRRATHTDETPPPHVPPRARGP
jgi:four helix bundle protein